MTDFRALAAAGRWADVNWMELSHEEQVEFLQLVRAAVPFVLVENGMEREQRRALPGEVGNDRARIEAATILYLGELEAAIEGEPPKARENWHEVRRLIDLFLANALVEKEATTGDPEMSRNAHAAAAIEYLNEIDRLSAFLGKEMDTAEDRDWLVETISEVACAAFSAGRHMQATWGKQFESDAVRGEKVAGGSRNSAHHTNGLHEDLRKKRFDRMAELVGQLGVDEAARQCSTERLGSWGAIKRQWNRKKTRDT